VHGDADQAALAAGVDRQRGEGRGEQPAALDDAQRTTLLGDEPAPVGRRRERVGVGRAAEPALVAPSIRLSPDAVPWRLAGRAVLRHARGVDDRGRDRR
jgi:hypothetical protein